MLNYDIRKVGHEWKFLKEGSHSPLKSFDRKKDAIDYCRDYFEKHGVTCAFGRLMGLSFKKNAAMRYRSKAYTQGFSKAWMTL
jgi:hypothetical protein